MYRILIADDEVIERTLLERKLRRSFAGECRVVSVGNGKEVLEADASFSPDILILDIEMPGISGLEVARELRHRGRKCAIIFLTAYDDFNYAKQAILIHAVDYLLKPYDEKDLLLAVEEAIRWSDLQKGRLSESEPALPLCKEEDSNNAETGTQQKGTGDRDARNPGTEEDPAGHQVKLLEFIQDHYMEDISVQDLSAYIGYSEVHTCRLFKQYFGQTFVSYLAHYRMRKAARLLLYSDRSVSEIGRSVGYANANYFGKVFMRIYGMTPSEYRAQEKK